MDDLLNELLTENIDLEDFFGWLLKDNDVSNPKLGSVEKSEFIPFFLEFVRTKTAWVCNEKTNDNNDAEKSTPVASSSPHTNDICNKQQQQQTSSQMQSMLNNNESSTQISGKCTNNNFEDKKNPQKEGKRVQVFSLGCAPYKQRGNLSNKKLPSKSPDYNNFDDFPPMGFNHKQNSNNINDNSPISRNQYYKKIFPKAGMKSFVSPENNFNNSEAFPPLGGRNQEVKTPRRITPTPVQSANNFQSKFGKSNFSSPPARNQWDVFRTSAVQESVTGLQQERELLKVTKSILPKSSSSIGNTPVKIFNEAKPIILKPNDLFICPDPEKITMLEKISIVCKIYDSFLSNNLVTNIASELYFLLEMIACRVSSDNNSDENNLFALIHNCVYFAVSVLSNQCNLLQILDKATLRSLEEIPYLVKFSPQLVSCIQLCFLSKQDVSSLLPSLTVVPFQVEKDSRVNFPDENAFVTFKRQRDLFYEILREWQENINSVDVRFQNSFARKAKQLITLNSSSINMFHLARLFQSQLIASCMCLEVNEVYDELLNDIQKNFPDKFKKLQERFLTPSCSGGLTPTPSFYGIQIFFAELIVSAGSNSLNQHLINVLVSKVLELNSTDIFSDKELSSLGNIRDKYVFLLHTLRLLGKFLGYLHFLPYGKEVAPSFIVKQQLVSRQNSNLPLNLSQLLIDSVNHGHVLLTVPWIVEFIGMVDPIGKSLEGILEALKVLMGVYRFNYLFITDVQSQVFLQVIIGWLFDVLHYQDNFYSLIPVVTTPVKNLSNGIDSLSIIDKQLIHSCCPYLIEFKVLIHNFLNGIKDKKREIRKITPFSTTKPNTSKNSTTSLSQFEHRFEENFFSLHPSSVKKTVEFLSERMASKVISKIRNIITSMKLSIADDVSNDKQVKSLTDHSRQKYIDEILNKKLVEAFKETRNKISALTENIYSEMISVLPTLLSDDIKQPVIEICCRIAFRISVEKILEWCNVNLLLDAMKSDIRNKVQHISKSEYSIEPLQNFNLSVWVNNLRGTVVKVHLNSFQYSLDNINSLFSDITRMLAADIPCGIKKVIFMLAVDLFINLLVTYPEKCCEQLNDYFALLCLNCPKSLTLEKLFICPKYFKFLRTSKHTELSQTKFLSLVQKLLNKKVVFMEDLSKCFSDIKTIRNSGINDLTFLSKKFDEMFFHCK